MSASQDGSEERGAELAELDEIAGYHLEQAFGYRRELGRVDQSARRLAADAARHLDAAGRRALDGGDIRAAVSLLERAESLFPPREIVLALQQSLIHGLGMSGRLPDAIARAARIAGECSDAGDLVGELQARLAGAIWRVRADPAGQIEELRALVEEARPPDRACRRCRSPGFAGVRGRLHRVLRLPVRRCARCVHRRNGPRQACGRPMVRYAHAHERCIMLLVGTRSGQRGAAVAG